MSKRRQKRVLTPIVNAEKEPFPQAPKHEASAKFTSRYTAVTTTMPAERGHDVALWITI
jgi:hypothetical protein